MLHQGCRGWKIQLFKVRVRYIATIMHSILTTAHQDYLVMTLRYFNDTAHNTNAICLRSLSANFDSSKDQFASPTKISTDSRMG